MLVLVEDTQRGPDAVRGIDLAGAAELARMFGVSRQRVDQLTRHPDFPPPIAELAMGSVWDKNDVRQYARDHGREIHEDAPPIRRRRGAGSS